MGTNGFDKRPQDINRNGRPKKKSALNEIIENYSRKYTVGQEGKRRRNNTLLAEAMWKIALDSKHPKQFDAIKYLSDRLGGKPTEKVQLTGDENAPMGVVFLPVKMTAKEWMEQNGQKTLHSLAAAAKTEDGA